ncbi:hypothetical protein JX265_011587 [Neoarthrinium moseri]|uniref:Cytochrome P450 n=1 Tax=Neoarthrinium moseri TaxID=1658444 RepID=A0A9Q0AHI5_9PEZI|nr:hypothetical protein JX265_011587 [Neoarthrinium moseri]
MHRMRRAPINRFLSRAQMLKLEAEVHEFTQRMCDKMLRTWGPFDVKEVYNCYTADIISQYAFGDDMKALMNELNITIPGQIQRALDKKESGRMFTDLIESDQLPEAEKTIFRLSGEGSTILAAGESPLNLKWTDLEQRPDLWAVIYEALRFAPGISHRPARIAREEDLFYKSENGKAQWVQSEFRAERWLLANGQQNYAFEKHLMSFGKGSRSCLGTNLAYCELFLLTAAMALRVLPRAKLLSSIEDVRYDHDLVVPNAKYGLIRAYIQIT